MIHDILITAGVYSFADREVTSGTVAAFLTILGYSMYDTIIVFDRIRENVPRMPRAAFTQIVNRSMSEVLTRSLITGLSTVFLITVLYIFGGETLQDFAFAMMVGVASGTYSSIFIAAPVLTAWKEREPAYRNRRAAIEDSMGYVPSFPEENLVEKIEAVGHVPDSQRISAAAQTPAAAPAPTAVLTPPPDNGEVDEPFPEAVPPPAEQIEAGAAAPEPPDVRPAARPAKAAEAQAPAANTPQARKEPLMSILVFFMTGLALWHFTVFVPGPLLGGHRRRPARGLHGRDGRRRRSTRSSPGGRSAKPTSSPSSSPSPEP